MAKVLDHLPQGIYVKDATSSFRYVYWNNRMETLFGISRDQVLGKTDHEVYPSKEAERQRRLAGFVMADRLILDIPDESVLTNQGEIPAHTVRVPVFDDEGNPLLLLGVIEDMREINAREELIRSQQAQLLHASKMSTLGEMSGGVAHEINNPLTVIMGFAQRLAALLDAGTLDADELKRCSIKIVTMTERIARIVRGLRTFAREASQDPFDVVPLSRVVADTLELCQQRFLNHGIKIQIGELPEGLTIECRAVQISQVLLNLFSNAFDAIQELPVKWIRLDAEDLGGSVQIAVTDSGDGIPSEIAAKMMHPFFTTKGVGQGTGLGLSISRGIVESHRGTLRHDPSAPNTRFVVVLPKSQATKRAA
jgi:PAS domain S-box-containing protein